MRRTPALLLAIAVSISACEKLQPAAPPPDATAPGQALAPPASHTAYLTASDIGGTIGGTVLIAANAKAGQGKEGVASFRARLVYDTTALELLEVIDQQDMMRAVNAQPGEIVVAGASTSPVSDVQILLARFRVKSDAPVAARLITEELNDGEYKSSLDKLVTPPGMRIDRMLWKKANLAEQP